jgi:drug/metabolite transporter (DMT)-like permease
MKEGYPIFFQSREMRGWLLMLLGTICFSAKAVLVKLAYGYDIDAVTLMTLRMGISLPFYIVIGFFVLRVNQLSKLTRIDHVKIISFGVAGYYLASLFDLMGLQYISAGFERLILFLYPTVVLLISAFILKRRIQKMEWVALVLGYLGIIVVYLHDAQFSGENITLGMLWVLGSAVTFAIYIVGSGQMFSKIGSMGFTVYAMSAASLAIVLHFLLTRPLENLNVVPELWVIAITIAIACTVIPTFLMAEGIKHLGAPKAALVGCVGPGFTALFAYFILGEIYTWVHFVGMLLVLSAVFIVGRSKKES